MSTKAQTVSIQLPSGRIVHTDVPTKAKSAPVADMSLLGNTVKCIIDPETKKQIAVQTGFVVYEVNGSLDTVLVRATLTPVVKGVGSKTLELLIAETELTPEKAVAQGMATFSHSLPTEGYYILKGATHTHVEELPADEPKAEEPKTEPEADQGQSHF